MRYYIIASPGSGKTYFFNKYKRKYGILRIYDLDWLKSKNKNKVLDILENVEDGKVVLGSLGEIRDDYKYYAVIIPKEQLIANIEKRKLKKRKRAIEKYWDNVYNALNDENKGYYRTIKEVKERNISTFQTIEECLYFINILEGKLKDGA